LKESFDDQTKRVVKSYKILILSFLHLREKRNLLEEVRQGKPLVVKL
jgi:hypothetical protein